MTKTIFSKTLMVFSVSIALMGAAQASAVVSNPTQSAVGSLFSGLKTQLSGLAAGVQTSSSAQAPVSGGQVSDMFNQDNINRAIAAGKDGVAVAQQVGTAVVPYVKQGVETLAPVAQAAGSQAADLLKQGASAAAPVVADAAKTALAKGQDLAAAAKNILGAKFSCSSANCNRFSCEASEQKYIYCATNCGNTSNCRSNGGKKWKDAKQTLEEAGMPN